MRDSEARLLALMEVVPALVFIADPTGKTVFASDRVVAYAGMPGEAMLGEGWLDLLHPDDRTGGLERWRACVETGRAYEGELRFRRHDGEYHTHLCRAEARRDPGGAIVEWFGACVDVEGPRRAEAAMREQAEELQTLLDTLPVGVWIAHDPDARHITGNRVGAELLRMGTGANLSVSAATTERPLPFRVLKDGREVPHHALPVQRAARGESVTAEELEHVFDDGSVIYTLVSAQPLHDPAGKPRGAVATVLDITGLRSVEASDRRKAEFLAELSHELRNALAPLSSSVGLLHHVGADHPPIHDLAATMQRQVDHVVSLVDDLLDVARVGRGEVDLQLAPLDLQEVVSAAIDIARPLVTARQHELSVHPAAEPLPIVGDRRRLTQVVANLLLNAAKYTDPGGRIRVTTETTGTEAVVRVRDTGFGIPPDHLSEIFKMFARIPEHGRRTGGGGLGIGLALARRMLNLHGGAIEARSDGPGHGSEFVVRLPLAGG